MLLKYLLRFEFAMVYHFKIIVYPPDFHYIKMLLILSSVISADNTFTCLFY